MSLFGIMVAGEHFENQEEVINNQLESQGKIQEVAERKERYQRTGSIWCFVFAVIFGVPSLIMLISLKSEEGDYGSIEFIMGWLPLLISIILLIGGIKRWCRANEIGREYVKNAKARKRVQIEEEERMRAEVRAEIEAEMKAKKKSQKK